MSKVKTFKFGDGTREVKVGDIVYMAPRERRDYGRDMVIQKVGRDLITIGYELNGRDAAQFYMEDGKQKTDYMGTTLYSSKAAYDEAVRQSQLIGKVTEHFRGYQNRITYEQAVKIAAILGIQE